MIMMVTQVIYPDTQLEMGRKGWTDRDLEKVVMILTRSLIFFVMLMIIVGG